MKAEVLSQACFERKRKTRIRTMKDLGRGKKLGEGERGVIGMMRIVAELSLPLRKWYYT